MIDSKITPLEGLLGLLKLIRIKLKQEVFSVNLEVTKRCNARCHFCHYWKTRGEKALLDFTPIVRKIRPLHVSITGGEPLLRDDLESIIRSLKAQSGFLYLQLMTNGILLDIEKAKGLWRAGLNQLCVSLDYLDERHDEVRGVKGLLSKLTRLLNRLPLAGIDNTALNTVIMEDNLDQIVPIAEQARRWGVKVTFSTYSFLKTGDHGHDVTSQGELSRVVSALLRLKRSHHHILNSDEYLQKIPLFWRQGYVEGCRSGIHWLQVTPEGDIKQCSELPVRCSWEDFTFDTFRKQRDPCQRCWYSCRGEAQTPLGVKRIVELNR